MTHAASQELVGTGVGAFVFDEHAGKVAQVGALGRLLLGNGSENPSPPFLASVLNPPSKPWITTSTDAPDWLTSRAASMAVSSAKVRLQDRLSSCPSLETVHPLRVARIRKVRWTIDRASLSWPDVECCIDDQPDAASEHVNVKAILSGNEKLPGLLHHSP
jgi:hypothetical protein